MRNKEEILNRLNRCQLLDLGFLGLPFTWTNGRKGKANIRERLDKALCIDSWRTSFPKAQMQNLPRKQYDYCPPLISLTGFVPLPLTRPFRMEAALLIHPFFYSLVKEKWSFEERDLGLTIERFVKVARIWSRDVCGNIFWNKKWVLAMLNGIQKVSGRCPNPFLENIETELVQEYNKLLL
ncbi:hypothetical protein ACSBR2_004938 [Camellia fascicularis]